MKKIILISSIALTLLSMGVKANTIVSGNAIFKLSKDEIGYVMANGTTSMIEALKTSQIIKNSDIGDNILRLLQARKSFTQLIAKK